MANFSGFTPAFQGASNVTDVLQKQEDAQRQLQAQAMLAKILQQYSSGAAPSGQGMAMQPPPPPGAAIQPGGVSPLTGGAQPAGNAPGGAGSSSPMGGALPPQPAMSSGQPPIGMDLQRLAQSAQSQGGNPGAQGAALQMLMKMMQPQANNATRLEIGDRRNDTSITNTNARDATSTANTNARINAKDLPTDQLLKEFTSQGNVIARMAPDNEAYPAELQKFDDLKKEIDVRRGKAGLPPKADKITKSGPEPVSTLPAQNDRVQVKDKDGNVFTIPADQLDDAITQGYTKI